MNDLEKLNAFECFWCKSTHLDKVSDDKYKCKSCGNVNYKITDNDKIKFTLASTYMASYKYDDADKLYKELAESENTKTKVQALYGRLLSFFGVTYIKDFNGSLVVTFSNYKPEFSSITECSYYKDIINSEYKDEYINKLNELDNEYKKIKVELDKGIKYDVFICTKISLKTKDNPNLKGYTEDSKIAEQLYDELTKKGLKVFYSDKVLSGIDYDAQIYSALMRSEKMLIISSDKEYLESPWVQSEWERWINFIKEDVKDKNSLYLFVPNNTPIELPLKLEKTQIFSYTLELINRLIQNTKERIAENNLISITTDEYHNKIYRCEIELEYENYDKVEKMVEDLLNENPEDAKLYILLLLCELRLNKESDLENHINPLTNYQNYNKAIRFANKDYKQVLKTYNEKIVNRIKEKEKELDFTNITISKSLLDKEFLNAEEKYKEELYSEAFEIYYRLSNEHSYAKAYIKTGKCYEEGKGTNKNYEKAFYWYEKAASLGSIRAKYNLGNMYYYGEGIPQDYEKAFYWYEKAASEENVSAQFNVGKMYHKGEGIPQDYEKAIYWYEKAGNGRSTKAQYELGCMYYDGEGTPKDNKKAFEWIKKAADRGHVDAQFKLGEMYEKGEGTTQDFNDSFSWYEKAATAGHTLAQNKLGDVYINIYSNYGDMQSCNKAFYWYERSANSGNKIAQNKLGDMYYFGIGTYENDKKALYWYEKSANLGYAKAQCNLANMYYNGEGAPQDYGKALYWYERSANAGDDWAQYNLGYMYYYGEGVSQDYKKALYWYEKAGDAGNTSAQNNLGNMYYNGEGTPQDYKKAFYWYERSANAGNASAQQNLSFMYKYGYGVEKNIELAEYWKRKSKENK